MIEMQIPEAVKDIIMVEELPMDNKTEGGIIMPGDVQQYPQNVGRVLSIGKEVTSEIEVGDLVMYHPQGGQAVYVDKLLYRALKDGELYGKIPQ